MENLVVTISREYGSGGRLVGERLAKELNIAYYDKELIELAAEKSGLSADYIKKSEEHASSSMLFGLSGSTQATAGFFMPYDAPVGDKAFFAQSAVIRELAEKGPCVILGRCAGYILRDNPRCISVFLHGSLDSRLERAIEVYGMPHKGLAGKLLRIDKGRGNYHKYYTGESWHDLRIYDLSIDTGMCGVDGAVAAIEAMVRSIESRR